MTIFVFSIFFAVSATHTWALNTVALKQRLDTDPTFRLLYEEHVKKFPVLAGQAAGYNGFNCTDGVSATIPTSVHALRPGDIKVVAAMGDSLTAANGAGANNVLEMVLTYRGMAATIGGDETLEQRVTVPNMLRKFNPHLFGYSVGVGPGIEWQVSYLNTAEPGNTAGHLPDQARVLIDRMQAHPGSIDWANDWKLINIFIGGNDICGYCHHPDGAAFAQTFINHIKDTLDILRTIPRVLVSIVGVLHVELARQIDQDHPFCIYLHDYHECKCEGWANFTDPVMSAVTDSLNQVEYELMMNGAYDTTDDFSVVIQPTINDLVEVPRLPNGKVDLSYFTPDCFHLSGRGQSTFARGIWNSMVLPVGQKPTNWHFDTENEAPICPDPACPFLRTTKNSVNCQRYWSPPKKQ